MSETEPLLGSETDENSSSIQETIAKCLESSRWHKIVITLITIDAASVLAELIYTLLTSDCIPVGSESPVYLEALQTLSLAITTFFLLEIPVSLYALGVQYYNPLGPTTHAGLHLFDATIIITTFVLEVVLKGRERELAGLLIVLRLWRLVKLVGGIAVGAGEIGEEDAKALADAQKELETTKADLVAAKDQIQRLQARLAEMGLNEAT